MPSTSMTKRHLLSALAFLVFGLLALGSSDPDSGSGSGGGSGSSDSWKARDNSMMAYTMMEKFVKKRLKAPSTAKFPSIWQGRDEHIEKIGDHKYRIVSYVDAQNSFGAKIRTKFIGEIEQVSDSRWKLLSLSLL